MSMGEEAAVPSGPEATPQRRRAWVLGSTVAFGTILTLGCTLAVGCILALGCTSVDGGSISERLETSPLVVGEMSVYFPRTSASHPVLRAMAQDMKARSFNFMGPEDFHYSAELDGYPFTLFTTLGEANVPQPGSRLYEHEFIHMAAAANVLDRYGVPLAKLMRPDGCAFTPRARFHEVCADYRRNTAPVYGASTSMPRLLEVVEGIAPDYERLDDFEVRLELTGVSLVDAACLWDLEAMDALEDLYDGVEGVGAFETLFAPHSHRGSCVEDHMARARFELVGPEMSACLAVTNATLNVRPGPSLNTVPRGYLEGGDEVVFVGEEEHEDSTGILWFRVIAPDMDCAVADDDRACWLSAGFVTPCKVIAEPFVLPEPEPDPGSDDDAGHGPSPHGPLPPEF